LKVVEANQFQRKFEKITKKVTQEIKDEIIKCIGDFCESPTAPPDNLKDSILVSKRLAKKYGKVRKFRAHHDYRIIYSINTDEEIITFLTIGHRKQIYKKGLKGL